ncbi:MAG: PqqD family protein [Ruminococcaceae bacterium]|nr:PqqD family protein [Oscillospiraceae bacterium]
MQIKKGFVMQKIAGRTVVVSTGELSKEFHGMIELNETAAFIWNGVAEGKQPQFIAEELSSEYGIALEKAQNDVGKMIDQMIAGGVVEDA